MNDRERKIVAAVRQAIGYVSRRDPIPESNLLLRSPLVQDYLQRNKFEDTLADREETLAEILRSLASEFGEESLPGKRDSQQQNKLFNLMYALLNGQRGNVPGVGTSTYDRDHAKVVEILAERFLQREERLLRGTSSDYEPRQLRDARNSAMDVSHWLNGHPGQLDLFGLRTLNDAALTIEDHHFYGEAQGHYAQVRERLQQQNCPSGVMRSLAEFATTRLAHCLMVQDALLQANTTFAQAGLLAEKLEDWEGLIHATHMRGVTYTSLDDYDAGLKYLRDAHALAFKAPFARQRQAWIQRDMIQALVQRRAFDEVPALARSSLSIREAAGDAQGCMMTLEIWGRALLAQHQYAAAEHKLNKALEFREAVPSRFFQAMLFASMAQLYGAWGKHDRASAFLGEAQALAQRFGMWHELNRLDKISKRIGLVEDGA